ncbi:hypothetical protein [Desulfatitalea alkaliphila]|uniref:Uncharacterized protein n=1 Tax=Desulfatitalea alkaliphila TaxID=2929485 RepID=A0AA41R4N6_9BACT|nr:hypothetical protein [Desulfatitalea alkaliphila]MCJ8500855.1 hypothetical protein [Desulfatitalea alkaliphila]
MSDASMLKTDRGKMNSLYEMAGFCEDPRDKDLISEAKWLLESQFMVIIAACEKYNDNIANWEEYVNNTVIPRVVGLLKDKLSADSEKVGAVIQGVVNSLQIKLDEEKSRLEKLKDNIQLLGGSIQ